MHHFKPDEKAWRLGVAGAGTFASGMQVALRGGRRTDEIGQLVGDVNSLITRLTDVLKIEHPILLAPMDIVADGRLAGTTAERLEPARLSRLIHAAHGHAP